MTNVCTVNHNDEKPGLSKLDQSRATRLITAYLSDDPQAPSLILTEGGDCIHCARGIAWATAGFAGTFADKCHDSADEAIATLERLTEQYLDGTN